MTGKNVYHLHGDFSVLSNSENPENVWGFIRNKRNSRVIIEGMEHCFCNALLDYSGVEKLIKAKENHEIILKAEEFKKNYDSNKKFRRDLLKIKDIDQDRYEMIMTKINYPNLKMNTEYYFDEFENIKDELYIIGMSPNNDSHIFDCINKNKNLTRIYFYYYSDSERKRIEEMFPKNLYIPKNAKDLWQSLNCNKKEYNSNYTLPVGIDKFIEYIKKLIGDTVSKEDTLRQLNKIPQFQAIRLCKLVKEDLKKRTLGNKLINTDEFESIINVALSEGILPSVLYSIYHLFN